MVAKGTCEVGAENFAGEYIFEKYTTLIQVSGKMENIKYGTA
jgi:hypothetical protein